MNYKGFCRNFRVPVGAFEFEKLLLLLCNVSVKSICEVISYIDKLVATLRSIFSVRFLRAHLCYQAPPIVVFLLSCAQVFAGGDLRLGGVFRSFPLSGVMEAEAGYGVLLRGGAGSPFSSYTRLKIDGSSAGIFNSAGAALEFFPLAFVGARAGGEALQNDQKYSAYDCDAYECLGRSYRMYFETELTLGAGRFFVQGRWRRQHWTRGARLSPDYVEPTSGLVLAGDGDDETIYIGAAGVRVSPRWTVLAALRYAESDRFQGLSRFPYIVLRFKQGAFSIGAGGGMFDSSLKDRDFAAVGMLSWEIVPSLGLK